MFSDPVFEGLVVSGDHHWLETNQATPEALPRVLRIQHDTIDPITGLSPYQIVFGRDRALAALPWEKFEEAPEASTFSTTSLKSM